MWEGVKGNKKENELKHIDLFKQKGYLRLAMRKDGLAFHIT